MARRRRYMVAGAGDGVTFTSAETTAWGPRHREDALMRGDSLRNQGGLMLVEFMVAMSIFLLILVGIVQIFDPSSRAYSTSEVNLGVQQNARVALDVVARQIRMAGYFPENIDQGAANDLVDPVRIQAATDTALVVAGDLDASCLDPLTTTCAGGSSRAFTFCLDTTGLRRVPAALGVGNCIGGDLLAESVTALGFAYFDDTDTPIPNPPTGPYQLDGQGLGGALSFANITQRAAVRRIVITVTARENVPGQPARAYTLTSDVRLRKVEPAAGLRKDPRVAKLLEERRPR
jgi:type II secretory pathway component PulJ